MNAIVKGLKLILVNILWVICSLPVITIGASSTAACYLCLKLINDDECNVVKAFFKSFKENFKQGTIIWLFVGPAFYAVTLCTNIIFGEDAGFFGKIGCFIFILFFAFTVFYVFPLLAHYHNTVKNFFKNSFFLGLQFMNKNFVHIIFAALFLGVWFYNQWTFIFGLCFIPIIIFYISCLSANMVFKQLDNKK